MSAEMERRYGLPSGPAAVAAALGALLTLGLVLGGFAGGVTVARAASAPTVSTGGASAVSYTGATLEGSVNPQGEATSYEFQYGTSSSYGSTTAPVAAGNGTDSLDVKTAIAGLQAGTTYRYRLLATSAAGTSYGSEHRLKTASVPLAISISGSPNPVIFGSPFYVQGSVTGAGDREVELQVNPYPYLAGFSTVGNPEVTTAAGAFSFPYIGLLINAHLRVSTVSTPAVLSPTLLEGVGVRVVLHIQRARRPGFFRFYGSIHPGEAGARVGVEVLRAGHYVNVNGTIARPAGAGQSVFSRVLRLKAHTLYRALVLISDPAHESSESASVRAP